MISSTVSGRASRMCSKMGFPRSFRRGLGVVAVRGIIRTPLPAANINAFMSFRSGGVIFQHGFGLFQVFRVADRDPAGLALYKYVLVSSHLLDHRRQVILAVAVHLLLVIENAVVQDIGHGRRQVAFRLLGLFL